MSGIETEYRLQKSFTVTLDATGGATQKYVGPVGAGERWEIRNTSVTTTSGCTFQSFRGDPINPNQIDYTEQGGGDSSDTVIKLQVGESISFKWSNGVVGATGVVTIEGSRFVPGRRAY